MKKYLRLHKTEYTLLGSILAFLCIFTIFFHGIQVVSDSSKDKELETLQNALEQNVTLCYATNGFYPDSLTYIEEHYGLYYDKDRFYIDYEPIGTNIRPDITIIEKGN